MKLGIAGTGGMVRDLLNVLPLLPLQEKWLFGRPQSEEKTRIMAEGMNGYVLDYDDLLAGPSDTVYIALPNDLHFSFARRALLAGKNVILEKPFTAVPAETEELIRLSREKDLMLVEAMNIHSLPAFRALKKELYRIGRPKMLLMNYTQYSSRYDRLKNGDRAPVFDAARAGGALMDLNVYNLHAIAGLMGEPKGVKYSANLDAGVDLSGAALLDYGTAQAVAVGAKDSSAPCISLLEGEEGTIRMDVPVNHLNGFTYLGRDGTCLRFDFEEGRHRLDYEFREFIERFDRHDTLWRDEQLELTLLVSRILYQARMDAGIQFPEDDIL